MITGTNKKCIISFSNSNGYYAQRLARLADSLRNNFDGDFLAWHNEAALGAPLHADNPYAFKIYAFQRALNEGYTQVLWLDSSVFAVAPVQPVFDHIEKYGYIIQDAGHYVGNWTNDRALDYFRMSRDEAMTIKCYGNAGFLGLDFTKNSSQSFFDSWKTAMIDGMFKGTWSNADKTESQDERCLGHRHDMVCGSILAHRSGMQLQSGEHWLQYAGVYDKILNDTIILKAQG